MEHASTALMMAAGILIALLILGALMFMVFQIGDYQTGEDTRREDTQIAEYNQEFLQYERDDLTLMDLQSVYNKIESNNKTSDNIITHNISADGVFKEHNTFNKESYDFTKVAFNKISIDVKTQCVFKCNKVTYSKETKKINYMEFIITNWPNDKATT